MKGRRSLIFDTSVVTVVPAAVLFSVYLLFAGHNAPGGGFVGGLVAGSALVLVQVDRGWEGVERMTRVAPEVFLGTGITTMVLVGAAGWVDGGEAFEIHHWSWDLPVVGTVKAGSTLPFDIGVYLVVVGTILSVLATLGREGTE